MGGGEGVSATKYNCQLCGQEVDCTCDNYNAPCIRCRSHVCVSTTMKDNPDITSREYLRRRIWSDAWVVGIKDGLVSEADRLAGVALEAYDKKFRDRAI